MFSPQLQEHKVLTTPDIDSLVLKLLFVRIRPSHTAVLL